MAEQPSDPTADDAEQAARQLEDLREQVRAKRYALQKARENGDSDELSRLGAECQRLVATYSALVARVMKHFPQG